MNRLSGRTCTRLATAMGGMDGCSRYKAPGLRRVGFVVEALDKPSTLDELMRLARLEARKLVAVQRLERIKRPEAGKYDEYGEIR